MGAREQDTERTSGRRKKKRADSRNSKKKQGEQGGLVCYLSDCLHGDRKRRCYTQEMSRWQR